MARRLLFRVSASSTSGLTVTGLPLIASTSLSASWRTMPTPGAYCSVSSCNALRMGPACATGALVSAVIAAVLASKSSSANGFRSACVSGAAHSGHAASRSSAASMARNREARENDKGRCIRFAESRATKHARHLDRRDDLPPTAPKRRTAWEAAKTLPGSLPSRTSHEARERGRER